MKMAKKMLAFVLTLVLIASAIIVPSTASAASYVYVRPEHVVEWPTVTQTGDIYVGQNATDKLSVSGGKVVCNGIEVNITWGFSGVSASKAGTFSSKGFYISYDQSGNNSTNNIWHGLTAPDDAAFTYTVKKTTLVIEEAPVASSLRPGDKLSSSLITGGEVKNPYCDWSYKDYKWQWSDANTEVTESGYYEAYFNVSDESYEPLKTQIYVTVSDSVAESKFETAPTIADFEYNPDIKWSDVKIEGGKVVDANTGKEVAGKYVVEYPYDTQIPGVGKRTISVLFVPDDPSTAKTLRTSITTNVSKAICRFVDDEGNEVTPEITLPTTVYNNTDSLKNSLIAGQLKTYPESATIKINGYNIGTRPFIGRTGTFDVEVSIYCQGNSNCTATSKTIKVTVVPTEYKGNLVASKAYSGNGIELKICEDNNPFGNNFVNIDGYYKIYVNGEHYTTTNKMPYTYNAPKSGKYDFKVVYEPKDENYTCIIANEMTASIDVEFAWNFTAKGARYFNDNPGYGNSYYQFGVKPGTIVEVKAGPSEKASYKFAKWKVVEGEVPEGTDLSKETLKVEMPDCNLVVEATYRFSFGLFIKNMFTTIFDFFGGVFK